MLQPGVSLCPYLLYIHVLCIGLSRMCELPTSDKRHIHICTHPFLAIVAWIHQIIRTFQLKMADI